MLRAPGTLVLTAVQHELTDMLPELQWTLWRRMPYVECQPARVYGKWMECVRGGCTACMTSLCQLTGCCQWQVVGGGDPCAAPLWDEVVRVQTRGCASLAVVSVSP